MKQAETAAVVEFKAQVDRMADFLISAGYDIERTHLMEAGARFQGARDWRTLRTELSSSAGSKKERKASKAANIPQLGGKELKVYFWSNGPGPAYCYDIIDQQWIKKLFSLRALCVSRGLDEVKSDKLGASWLDYDFSHRMGLESIVVQERYFKYVALTRYDDDNEAHTDDIVIDDFLEAVLAAAAKGQEILFYGDENDAVDCLQEEAGATALQNMMGSFSFDLTYYGAIKELTSETARRAFAVKPEYAHLDDKQLAAELEKMANTIEADLLKKAGL